MIPAPFIEKLTAILAWLAERLAEIRERNALRDQAALDQAGDNQAEDHQAGDGPAALDPTRADALPPDCALSPRDSGPAPAPESCPQSPLASGPDSDSFPHPPAALVPAAPASSAAPIVAPAAAAPPRHQAPADGSVAALPAMTADPGPRPILRPPGRRTGLDRTRCGPPRRGRNKQPIRSRGSARPKLSDGTQIRA
ncbi:MAG: hypothetical protein HIU82_13535 [Proteobacteria bacterium]|nr:hypothetical protein [Pseudomonadota bacterium]